MSPASAGLLAIFPLGVVAFPGTLVPLHIFEPRYRTLISDHRQHDTPFGLVFGDDDSHASIGCTVDVTAVLQQFADGRSNIVVRGHRRFRIVSPEQNDAPYMVAQVSWLDDDEEAVPPSPVDAVRKRYRRAAELNDWGINLPVDVEPDPGALSWRVGDSMHLTQEARQQVLEMTSPRERIETELRWLEAMIGE